MVEIAYRQAPQDAELFAQTLLSLVESWWEDWMRHADRLLDDPDLENIVHQVLLKRWPKSRTHGRLSTPAEVWLLNPRRREQRGDSRPGGAMRSSPRHASTAPIRL